MITPTKDIDPAKGRVLGQFILYFACQGQAQAEPLGYSPLPSTLVAIDFDAVNAIKGHPPVPSSVNTKTCPGNPAVSGKIHIPSPNTGQVDTNTKTSSSGGGGGGASPTPGAGGAAGSNHTGQSTPTTGSSIAGSSTSASAAAAGPSTLPSGEAASLQAQAAEDIQGQKAVSALPLVIAGLAILALIFGPLFLRMRTKPEKR